MYNEHRGRITFDFLYKIFFMQPNRLLFTIWMISTVCTQALPQSAVLDSYVEEGLTGNLALQQQNIHLEKNIAALQEAKALFLPTLDLDARYSRAAGGRLIEFPIGDILNPVYGTLNQLTESSQFPTLNNEAIPFLRPQEHETRLRFVQPILQPGLLYNQQIRHTQVDIQSNAVAVYKRQLEADIRSSYYTYLKTVRVIDLYQKVRQLQEENIAFNEKLFKNDKITYDVIYASKADLSETQLKLAEAEKNRKVAATYFNFLLNKSLDASIETDTVYTFQDVLLAGEDELVALSLQSREEIKQLNSSIVASGQNVKLNKSRALPTLNLVVDYGFQGTNYRFTSNDDFVQGSLLLNWRIFGGMQNRSRIMQATLDKQRLQTQQSELQNQIKLQVTTAAENVKVARQSIQTTSERLESARKYFNIVNRKYREGAALYIEYLSALTTLTNAGISKIVAEYDYQIKLIELNRTAAR
jgi:outer membrane protein TolC